MKQVIVIRTDLGMSPGKMVAQGAHASLLAERRAKFFNVDIWAATGMKKVVLAIGSMETLQELINIAVSARLGVSVVSDAGLTEVEEGTITCIAIGPDKDEKIDAITGHLKLL